LAGACPRFEFSDRLVFEVLDQNGVALFASDFKPNPVTPAPKANEGLIKEISQSKSGHFERHGNLYSFSPIESSGWVAVVEQPRPWLTNRFTIFWDE
jgi:hypothetical protein